MKIYINEDFWTDPEIEELGPEEKLALLWILSNPNCNLCGFTKFSNRRFEFETGLSSEILERACQGLAKGFTSPSKGFVWSRNFVAYQFGRGPALARNNLAKSVVKNLAKMPSELQDMFLEEYPELKELAKPFLSPPQAPPKGKVESRKKKVESRSKKEKGENDPNLIAEKISNLVESWSAHLTQSEQWQLHDNFQKWLELSADDWRILEAWYADQSERSKFRTGKKIALIENVDEEIAKARKAGFTADDKPQRAGAPDWLPENWRVIAADVTGQPAETFKIHSDVPAKHRFAFERRCRGIDQDSAA